MPWTPPPNDPSSPYGEPYPGHDPYGGHDSYASRDPYANHDPYASHNPYANQDPYTEHGPTAEHPLAVAVPASTAARRSHHRGSWGSELKSRLTAITPRTRRFALLGVAAGGTALLLQRLLGGTPAPAAMKTKSEGNAMGPSPADMSPAPSPSPVVLAKLSSIAVGSAKIFASQKVVVTRPNSHTVKAFSAVCTHQGCVVNKVIQGKIHCPCHGGVYNLDGTVAAGPPPAPLPAAPNVHIRNGRIEVTG